MSTPDTTTAGEQPEWHNGTPLAGQQPAGAGEQYAFSNSAPEAPDQLAVLEHYLDPVTTGVIDPLTLPAGARCLDIGAGGGSVARWLADRTGPDGHVVAVDLDPGRLDVPSGVEVRQHDIRNGVPAGGPWDLIHARLVLLHLPSRLRLLRQLAASLNPGGWLVLGEFSSHPLHVLTACSDAEAVLFHRVIAAMRDVLANHGADLDWAHRVHSALAELGLADIHTVEHAESWTGGGRGAQLHQVNTLQMQDALLATGLTRPELVAFRRIVQDPRFVARSWQFVCTRGRTPPHDQA